MKKNFLKIAKELGFQLPTIRYERPERDTVVYYISIYKNDEFITIYDCGYFIGEENTEHSKDRIIPDFREFLNTLTGKIYEHEKNIYIRENNR